MGTCTSCARNKDRAHDGPELDKTVDSILPEAIDSKPTRKDLIAAATLWRDEKQRQDTASGTGERTSNATLFRVLYPATLQPHPRVVDDEVFHFSVTIPPWWDARPATAKHGVRYQRVFTSGRRRSPRHLLCDAEVHISMVKLDTKCKPEVRAKLAQDLFLACGGKVLKCELLNHNGGSPVDSALPGSPRDGGVGGGDLIAPLLRALREDVVFHGVAEYAQPDGSASRVEQFVLKGPHPRLMMEVAFVTSNTRDTETNREHFVFVGNSLRCQWVRMVATPTTPPLAPLSKNHSMVSSASMGSSLNPSFAAAFNPIDQW
jgi:hypothetical protein